MIFGDDKEETEPEPQTYSTHSPLCTLQRTGGIHIITGFGTAHEPLLSRSDQTYTDSLPIYTEEYS